MRHFGPTMAGWPMGGWSPALMMVGLLVFWCLLSAGVVAVILFSARRSRSSTDAADSPQEILAQRFVRGELDEEEYVRRTRDLAETFR
jgi:putative membrane protein